MSQIEGRPVGVHNAEKIQTDQHENRPEKHIGRHLPTVKKEGKQRHEKHIQRGQKAHLSGRSAENDSLLLQVGGSRQNSAAEYAAFQRRFPFGRALGKDGSSFGGAPSEHLPQKNHRPKSDCTHKRPGSQIGKGRKVCRCGHTLYHRGGSPKKGGQKKHGTA